MARSHRIFALALAGLLVVPVAVAVAAEVITYAEEEGAIKTVPVVNVRTDSEEEFNARVLVAGRKRTLKIPSRLVVRFRRGDGDDINQWARRLATGKRLAAAGQLATRGTVPGAEEHFTRVAYTVEKGTPGQEKTERAEPWHNMYALYYLIETRLEMGTPERLQQALGNIEEFEKRSKAKKGRKLEFQVPDPKGGTRPEEGFCWGATRLSLEVMLFKERILAALEKGAEATAAYDALIDLVKKKSLSPVLLREAIMGKAEIEALGKPSEQQEQIYASAGNTLTGLSRAQPDLYGKKVLRKAANLSLLKGADLLLESAQEGKLSYNLPLSRYRKLKEGEGKNDPALYMGALAGMGVCLTEQGQGQEAYEALLEVVDKGTQFPRQMARALYYLGKAAPLYAKEIEARGGKADFLRAEAERWHADLRERYPSSDWAKKVQAQ
jgi:hypothetical protein